MIALATPAFQPASCPRAQSATPPLQRSKSPNWITRRRRKSSMGVVMDALLGRKVDRATSVCKEHDTRRQPRLRFAHAENLRRSSLKPEVANQLFLARWRSTWLA